MKPIKTPPAETGLADRRRSCLCRYGCDNGPEQRLPLAGAAATTLPTITVSMVPKLLGLTVFEANEKGAQQVVRKLGIKLTYTAPATASAEGQVAIFDAEIAQHYNVITMSSDDPTVPAPVLKKAMKDGIQVITYDSDVPSARDFFIQDTAYSAIARP